MKTRFYLTYKNLHKDDLSKINMEKLLNNIQNINYSPSTEKINILKKSLLEVFSNHGFITDINLKNSKLRVNGIKEKTGLAIQTGNVARFYADMLKLQWLYKEKKINNAIYVCLSKESEKESYSGNIIHIDRALREINFFDKIIDIPILFISLDFTHS